MCLRVYHTAASHTVSVDQWTVVITSGLNSVVAYVVLHPLIPQHITFCEMSVNSYKQTAFCGHESGDHYESNICHCCDLKKKIKLGR